MVSEEKRKALRSAKPHRRFGSEFEQLDRNRPRTARDSTEHQVRTIHAVHPIHFIFDKDVQTQRMLNTPEKEAAQVNCQLLASYSWK
jgi:hypothetical protein